MSKDPANALSRRYDFVLFFDVVDGNPNGDPDAANAPRQDFATGDGLVTDVAIKRKIRNYVQAACAHRPGFDIYVRDGVPLNSQHLKAVEAVRPGRWSPEELKRGPKSPAEQRAVTTWMCQTFFDVRAFGAVMSTGVNAGQVRGPVQLGFSRSVEPIEVLDVTITRSAPTAASDAGKAGSVFGRKFIVPYALYRLQGVVSPLLASDPNKGTGFDLDDLQLLWRSLWTMFEIDRSAAKGLMSSRRLVVFQHTSPLGDAPAHRLFDRVSVQRTKTAGEGGSLGASASIKPARAFSDYTLDVEDRDLPRGVTVLIDEAAFDAA